MTRMKDSGIEWIGEVPEEWGLKPIKYLVSTPVTDGPHETPTLYDEGIPFLSAESVKNGILDSRYKRGYISETAHKIFSRKVSPQKNDIFIVKSGATTGNVGIVTTDEIFDIWSPLALVRTRSDLANQKFVYYFMLSDAFTKQIQNKWSFGTQQNIGMGVIEKIKLVVPSLDEQTQIANFLDKKVAQLDSVKSLLEEQIKTLEDYRQSLIYETVTKGLDKTVPLKESGIDWIGQIPEGWGVKPIKYLVSTPVTDGPHETPTLYDEGIPFLSAESVKNGILDFRYKRGYISETAHKIFSRKVSPQKNDIFIVKSGATTGNVGIVNTDEIFDIWSPLALVRTRSDLANQKFIYYFMLSDAFTKQIQNKWSFGTQQNIGMGVIEKIKLVVPPLGEQTPIADFLDKKTEQINQMIAIKKEQIENINKQRQTLIYDYVTGKGRI